MSEEETNSQWHYLSVLVILTACALLLSARLVYLYLDDPYRFPINTIKIAATYDHITHKELEGILEQYAQESFFTLPVKPLQKKLSALSWANTVTIERQWPDILKIVIEEKKPIAVFNNTLMTKDGRVFKAPLQDLDNNLPLLKGSEDHAKEILQVYQKLSNILSNYSLKAVSLELRQNESWELNLSNGILLRLGKRDLELRINRFCKAYPAVFGDVIFEKSAPLVVDLRYPRGMAVQWKNKREDNG